MFTFCLFMKHAEDISADNRVSTGYEHTVVEQ